MVMTTNTTTTTAKTMAANAGLGVFYAVGVGPGDPELITLKAARILAEADVIFAPTCAGGRLGIAIEIVAPLGLPAAKFREVALPMSRDRDAVGGAYQAAVAEIACELEGGRIVAWVTAGDPLFYGTSLYVLEELRRFMPAVRMEVVPGVTSMSAAAARAGLDLARLDDGLLVIPAAYGLERLPKSLDEFSTICLLKVNSVFDSLLDRLRSIPQPFHAVYVERVGMPGERVVTDLDSLRGQKLPYFSMVLLRRGPRDSVIGRGNVAKDE
jgi:precorrin-2/cobalt-factor-2 C20-methyltransferase